MYAVDVAKRPATYRVPPDLLAAVAAKAAECGESVTDVVIRGMEAYIRDDGAAGIAPQASPIAAPVHTPVHTPVEVSESYVEPAAVACKHPAEYVDGAWCRACSSDVW